MTKTFIRKNLALGLEFDTYIVRHPAAQKKIPSGATVIITAKNDPKFSEASMRMARRTAHGKYVEARKEGSTWRIEPIAA